jgi:hypothetical protein
VGELLKKAGPTFLDTLDKADRIIKWFTNHSRALAILQDQQLRRQHTYIQSILQHNPSARVPPVSTLTFVYAVITRWTSHYLACSRLINLHDDLQVVTCNNYNDLLNAAGSKRQAQETAGEVLDILKDRQFWMDLSR